MRICVLRTIDETTGKYRFEWKLKRLCLNEQNYGKNISYAHRNHLKESNVKLLCVIV